MTCVITLVFAFEMYCILIQLKDIFIKSVSSKSSFLRCRFLKELNILFCSTPVDFFKQQELSWFLLNLFLKKFGPTHDRVYFTIFHYLSLTCAITLVFTFEMYCMLIQLKYIFKKSVSSKSSFLRCRFMKELNILLIFLNNKSQADVF